MPPLRARTFALLLATLSTAACGNLLGLGDFEDGAQGAGGAGGSGATTTSSDATTGTGGGSTTATTTSSGTGGQGTGGGMFCTPDTTKPCYDGPAGTEGVGLCKEGTATCEPDGSAYGPCTGQVVPAAESCANPADENCAPDCAEHQWSVALGGANEDFGAVIAIDAAGNSYVSGQFNGSTVIGSEVFAAVADYDTFVAKIDPQGAVLWAKHYGSLQYVSITDAKVDPQGNLVFAGAFGDTVDFGGKVVSAPNGGGVVVKIDPDGNCLWAFPFGSGGSDFADSLALDPAGNILVTGSFVGPITQFFGSLSSTVGQDPFVFKLDGAGNPLWIKSFPGTTGGDFGNAIASDSAGNVLLAGIFRGAVSFAGGPSLTAGAGGNGYIVKLDALGNHMWSKLIPGSPSSSGGAVAADGMGRVYATGSFQGTTDLGGGTMTSAGSSDVFLVQFDGAGNHLWSKRFGGSGSDSGSLLVNDGPQHMFFEGSFSGSIDLGFGPIVAAGSTDAFFARFDESGAIQWNRAFEFGAGVAIDGTGALFLASTFTGSADLGGPAPLVDAGNGDMFVAKLARPLPLGVP